MQLWCGNGRKARKIERNAYKNFVSRIRPKISPRILPKVRPKICPKICPKIRQKIRPKNPSQKSVQKSVQISVSFCNCDCPDWFCQCQASVEDVASSLNVFMGSMATLHEGCSQVYICSRGQVEAVKNEHTFPRPALLRKCQCKNSLESPDPGSFRLCSRRETTKTNCLGPDTFSWGGGLPR